MSSLTGPKLLVRTIGVLTVLGAMVLSGTGTHAAGGTLQFHATVSGKGHDTGSFSRAIKSAPSDPILALTFIGCAIVKQKLGGGSATYQLQVRTTGVYFAGTKPSQPGVNLTVDNYHPSASSGTYTGMDAGGTFSINGHSYGDGVTPPKSVVQVRNGGLSGTWTDTEGVRNYPAKVLGAVHGFRFTATWRCTNRLHVTQK